MNTLLTLRMARLGLASVRYSSNQTTRLGVLRPLRGGIQSAKDQTSSRPHAITIFPGDYTDDYTWDDDEDFTDDLIKDEEEETSRIAEELARQEEQEQQQREKWLRNAEAPVRQSMIDDVGRAYGRGGRKRAQARVWIQPGMGEVVVNKRDFIDYFPRMSDREQILTPFVVTDTIGEFDVKIVVKGGGSTGQAGAVRLGIANALNHYNPDLYRPILKPLGLLTRDARKVERKKTGHVKARKSPQWVRR